MDYREETGTVSKLRGRKALVKIDVAAEGGCGSCGCKCSKAADGARVIEVQRDDLQKGDRVKIRVPVRSGYLGMLMIFVLPMIFCVTGMLLGVQFGAGPGDSNLMPLAGGAGGLALAFGIAWLVERIVSKQAPLQVQRLARSSG